MASIRRPHSPAKQQHLLRHHHPFASSSPPSSPLRHSSSSPRTHHHLAAAGYPHPFLFFSRRPLPRFAAFFLLGSFLGLLHFLSHLPHTPHIHPNGGGGGGVVSTNPLNPNHHRHQFPIVRLQDDDDEDGGAAGVNRKKLLIVVTPTRARAAQAYYLSRMGQTLRLVDPPVLWVVVEAGKPTPEAAAALRRTSVMHRYIGCCDKLNASLSSADDLRPHQMNAALELVENHRLDGIVYFAHEEGVYSLDLFHRLRQIRRFGTWPVPVISENTKDGVVLEGPVCKQNQVVGWHTSEDSSKLRRFHVAMSGFAFNSTMLWDAKLRSHLAWNSIRHPDTVKEGFQGTTFVEQLVEDESQMEGVPADCSHIMNWHMPFGSENLAYPKGWRVGTNLDVIIPLK